MSSNDTTPSTPGRPTRSENLDRTRTLRYADRVQRDRTVRRPSSRKRVHGPAHQIDVPSHASGRRLCDDGDVSQCAPGVRRRRLQRDHQPSHLVHRAHSGSAHRRVPRRRRSAPRRDVWGGHVHRLQSIRLRRARHERVCARSRSGRSDRLPLLCGGSVALACKLPHRSGRRPDHRRRNHGATRRLAPRGPQRRRSDTDRPLAAAVAHGCSKVVAAEEEILGYCRGGEKPTTAGLQAAHDRCRAAFSRIEDEVRAELG